MRTNLSSVMVLLWLGLAFNPWEAATVAGAPRQKAPRGRPDDSPTALVASPDGARLFVACATANQVAIFDTASSRTIGRIDLPASPLGLAVSRDGRRLFAACAAPTSVICIIDVPTRQILGRISAGHTAMSPVLSPDERTLYVCERFDDDVAVIDLERQEVVRRLPVEREPVAAALTPDGRRLLVANHLHAGHADNLHAQAGVSVFDPVTGRLVKHLPLALGATFLRGIAISPDARFAAVTFVRARFWLTTTEVGLGRMNGSALAVLDLARLDVVGILLLDQTAHGAANPWAVTWLPDGKTIAVSHAGTHEVSLIDAPVETDRDNFFSLTLGRYFDNEGPPILAPPRHPVHVRARVPLPGQGPRALAAIGSQLYVANYYSDNLARIDLASANLVAEPLALGPVQPPSLVRQGERWFNDANLCLEGWQSCASCHDTDGRTDGFNWDLLNDGRNNPKNTKSLLWAYRTPPMMALGVRANAAEAVRAGLEHILFTDQPDDVPAAIEVFLRSLQPVPSPHLVNGHLSATAERGRRLFMSARTGCADCHPPPLFTDCAAHDVGTAEEFHGLWAAPAADNPSDQFYTPTLVELWRTAPYLHNGSASNLGAVLGAKNPEDRHGKTSRLTPQEREQLIAYMLSL